MELVSSKTLLNHGSTTEQMSINKLKTQIPWLQQGQRPLMNLHLPCSSDGSYHMATNTPGVLSSVLVPPVFSWLTVPACVEVTCGPTSSVATVRGLAHGNKDSRSAFIHLCISCWAHHWCAEPVCSVLCVWCVVPARQLQLDWFLCCACLCFVAWNCDMYELHVCCVS